SAAFRSREHIAERAARRALASDNAIRFNRAMGGLASSPDNRQGPPVFTADPAALLRVPRATYRLQLGPDLTFDDAAGLVPYLAALGISDCYISPFFEAASNRSHGYDVSDHGRFRAELGARPRSTASPRRSGTTAWD